MFTDEQREEIEAYLERIDHVLKMKGFTNRQVILEQAREKIRELEERDGPVGG